MDAESVLLILVLVCVALAAPAMALGINFAGWLRYVAAILFGTSLAAVSYVAFGWFGALLALLFGYALLQVSFAFGLPSDWLTGPVAQLYAACVRLFKAYVVDRPPDLLVAGAAALCALQTAVILCIPTRALHRLSAEWGPKFAALTGLGAVADLSERWRLESYTVRSMQCVSKALAALLMLPALAFVKVVASPSASRLLVLGVLVPYAAASAAWRLLPPNAWTSLLLPAGWVDTGKGAARQMIAWVSLVSFAAFALPLWLLKSMGPSSRAFVEWLAGGEVTSAVVLGGAAAASLVACVLAGLHADADAAPPHAQSPDGAGMSPAEPRAQHLTLLFLCLLAAASVHMVLPAFNRKAFAVMRLSGRR